MSSTHTLYIALGAAILCASCTQNAPTEISKPNPNTISASTLERVRENTWSLASFDPCSEDDIDTLRFEGQDEVIAIPLFTPSEARLSLQATSKDPVDLAVWVMRSANTNPTREGTRDLEPILHDDDSGERGMPALDNVVLDWPGEYFIVFTSWHGKAVGEVNVFIDLQDAPICEPSVRFEACLWGCAQDEGDEFVNECFQACEQELCLEDCFAAGEDTDACWLACDPPGEPWDEECVEVCDDVGEEFFAACFAQVENDVFCFEQSERAFLQCIERDCTCFLDCTAFGSPEDVCLDLCF